MIGGILPLAPRSDGLTSAGTTIASGIMQGAQSGQLSLADQEAIALSATTTPGGNAYVTRNVLALAAAALLVGVGAGYFFKKKRSR